MKNLLKKIFRRRVDPYGIENVCFSIAKRNDTDKKSQRLKHGFDDTELYNLDVTIAQFVLPRLKRFKELSKAYPGYLTEDEWSDILDKIIFAFEITIDCVEYTGVCAELENLPFKEFKEKWKEYDAKRTEGLKLFAEHYNNLWW